MIDAAPMSASIRDEVLTAATSGTKESYHAAAAAVLAHATGSVVPVRGSGSHGNHGETSIKVVVVVAAAIMMTTRSATAAAATTTTVGRIVAGD